MSPLSERCQRLFTPGSEAASLLLALAREAGVGQALHAVGDGLNEHDRGMIEGRRYALLHVMRLARLDPLTADKPRSET